MNIKKLFFSIFASVFLLISFVPQISYADYSTDDIIGLNSYIGDFYELPDSFDGIENTDAIAYSLRNCIGSDFTPDSPYFIAEIRTLFPADEQHWNCTYAERTFFALNLSKGFEIEEDGDWVVIYPDEENYPYTLWNDTYRCNTFVYNSSYLFQYGSWIESPILNQNFSFRGYTLHNDEFGSPIAISELHYNKVDGSMWGRDINSRSIIEFTFEEDKASCYNTSLGGHVIVDNIISNIDEVNVPIFDVDVSFTPTLSGEVDRSFLANGQTCYYESLTMHVQNNSSTSIQYSMSIYDATDMYMDNPIFMYLVSGYVYSPDLRTQQTYFENNPRLFTKQTCWVYLNSGERTEQTIKYSQLPLEQKHNYRVVVKAVATDYDYASDMVVPEYEDVYTDLYQFKNPVVVYDSVFSIKYLGDVPYDYNDTSNGITPYASYDDYQRAYWAYTGYQDDEGNMTSYGQSLWDNPSSWKNQFEHSGSSRVPSFVSSGDTSLIRQSNSILGFFGNFLNFVPAEIKVIFVSGVTAIVAIIILKFVRG